MAPEPAIRARELTFSQSREAILQLVEQYRRHKPDIQLNFINPEFIYI